MKTKLNELSMADFISLSCGDTSVLLDDNDTTDKAVLEHIRSELIADYKTITNPSGMKAVLLDKEDESKLKAKILMFRICSALCSFGDYNLAGSVMNEYESGYSKKGEQMEADINKRLREAEFMLKRISSSKDPYVPPTEKEIRDSFDKEIAGIMTYFKMPLDIHKTSASVYANIVHQAIEDMKRKTKGR